LSPVYQPFAVLPLPIEAHHPGSKRKRNYLRSVRVEVSQLDHLNKIPPRRIWLSNRF